MFLAISLTPLDRLGYINRHVPLAPRMTERLARVGFSCRVQCSAITVDELTAGSSTFDQCVEKVEITLGCVARATGGGTVCNEIPKLFPENQDETFRTNTAHTVPLNKQSAVTVASFNRIARGRARHNFHSISLLQSAHALDRHHVHLLVRRHRHAVAIGRDRLRIGGHPDNQATVPYACR